MTSERQEVLKKYKKDFWSNSKKDRLCIVCGETYKSVKESQTCSPKCRGLLKSSNYSRIVQCKICGKEIKRALSHIASGRAETCSAECQYKSMSINMQGDKHPNWQGGLDKKDCPICHKEFEYYPHLKKVQRFCSYECKYKHLAVIMSGKNNNLWNGGTTKLNLKLRFELEQWRNNVLKEHDYTCFITGERGAKLEIHHEVPFYKIREKVLKSLKLNYERYRLDYTDDELELIVKEFKEEHKKVKGYPLRKDIHREFHNKYGYRNTNEEQLQLSRKEYQQSLEHLTQGVFCL